MKKLDPGYSIHVKIITKPTKLRFVSPAVEAVP